MSARTAMVLPGCLPINLAITLYLVGLDTSKCGIFRSMSNTNCDVFLLEKITLDTYENAFSTQSIDF